MMGGLAGLAGTVSAIPRLADIYMGKTPEEIQGRAQGIEQGYMRGLHGLEGSQYGGAVKGANAALGGVEWLMGGMLKNQYGAPFRSALEALGAGMNRLPPRQKATAEALLDLL
jgi:hypothetical protein